LKGGDGNRAPSPAWTVKVSPVNAGAGGVITVLFAKFLRASAMNIYVKLRVFMQDGSG
jgi:hypothetical protein